MAMEAPYAQAADMQNAAAPSKQRKRASMSPSQGRPSPMSPPASTSMLARKSPSAGPSRTPAPAGLPSTPQTTGPAANKALSGDVSQRQSASQGPEQAASSAGESSVTPQPPAKPMPPRQRLPPTIDPSLVHQSLCARQAFFDALLSDQRAALQPDYKTAFKSANDVVQRLLPYHVWHVNEGDLYHILGKGVDTSALNAHSAERSESGNGVTPPVSARQAAKRRRIDFLESIPDAFPTEHEADHYFTRYAEVHARAKRLRNQLVGAVQRDFNAPFGYESAVLLDRFALEAEREQFAEEQETFRREKEQAAAAGVSWDELIRITAITRESEEDDDAESDGEGKESASESASGSESDEEESDNESAPSQTVQSPPPPRQPRATQSPSTPGAMRGGAKRGRGRPRKTMDRSAASTQGSPAGTPSQSAGAGYVADPAGMPLASPASAPQMLATPNQIPQHPITLVLPLAALPRLNELGITPVPAPHLLPAIRARQAAQAQGIGPAADGAFARYNTAPRPGPPDQQEPALLLGITIGRIIVPGRSGAMGGSGAATGDEMLHISVVLPKFDPQQLSNLAGLMQSLQTMQPGSLPVPADPRGNTAVGAVVAAYVAGGVNVPAVNKPHEASAQAVENTGSSAGASAGANAAMAVAPGSLSTQAAPAGQSSAQATAPASDQMMHSSNVPPQQ